MPMDAVTVRAVVNETSGFMTGARIEKVQQPDGNRIVLTLRKNYENRKLLLCAAPGSARIHFTDISFENPPVPSPFCMLLRKYLSGASILSVAQERGDRIVSVSVSSLDELGDSRSVMLYVEMINKTPQISLVDRDGRILDCIHRRSPSGTEDRIMLPGMFYSLPAAQDRMSIFDFTPVRFLALHESCTRSADPGKAMFAAAGGISPLISREMCLEAYPEEAPVPAGSVFGTICSGLYTPYILYDGAVPVDFSFTAIRQYGAKYRCVSYPSFSEMLDVFYREKEAEAQKKRNGAELRHIVSLNIDRLSRKISGLNLEMKNAEDREKYRIRAELISSNLYRISDKDRFAVVENYYEQDCPSVRIDFPPEKNARQYAAALFKKYSKLKSAETHLLGQLEEATDRLDYFRSVEHELDIASTMQEYRDIRLELTQSGAIRPKQGTKQKKARVSSRPGELVSPGGYRVLYGRNNLQNEELTFTFASRFDLWFHVKNYHGSHVILRCDGATPSDDDILFAADTAVRFSEIPDADRAQVDFTQVRYVKKIPGSLPGMVRYTNQNSITVRRK